MGYRLLLVLLLLIYTGVLSGPSTPVPTPVPTLGPTVAPTRPFPTVAPTRPTTKEPTFVPTIFPTSPSFGPTSASPTSASPTSAPTTPIPTTNRHDTIFTVIGNGNGTTNFYSTISGEAGTSVNLDGPWGTTINDLNGNMYVTDNAHSRVLFYSSVDETVVVFAGTGNKGYSGDGTDATSAMLNSPKAASIGKGATYLYIADTGNHLIRRVEIRNGIISTVAGNFEKYGTTGGFDKNGPATNAGLKSPYSISVVIPSSLQTSSYLYIADYGNNQIRMVDGETGKISTVAGGGTSTSSDVQATSAILDLPTAVWAVEVYDRVQQEYSCQIYIVENGANRVRKVKSDGIIVTFAGISTGRGGFSGDGGPATAATLRSPMDLAVVTATAGTYLYITDAGNHRIRKVSPAGSDYNITTIAGDGDTSDSVEFNGDYVPSLSAKIGQLRSIAVDKNGKNFEHKINNLLTTIRIFFRKSLLLRQYFQQSKENGFVFTNYSSYSSSYNKSDK